MSCVERAFFSRSLIFKGLQSFFNNIIYEEVFTSDNTGKPNIVGLLKVVQQTPGRVAFLHIQTPSNRRQWFSVETLSFLPLHRIINWYLWYSSSSILLDVSAMLNWQTISPINDIILDSAAKKLRCTVWSLQLRSYHLCFFLPTSKTETF